MCCDVFSDVLKCEYETLMCEPKHNYNSISNSRVSKFQVEIPANKSKDTGDSTRAGKKENRKLGSDRMIGHT